jgi:hypothetical protein
VLANNDAPGSDCIDVSKRRPAGMHTWRPSQFGCLQLPTLVPGSASSSTRQRWPVSPTRSLLPPFSSPERVRPGLRHCWNIFLPNRCDAAQNQIGPRLPLAASSSAVQCVFWLNAPPVMPPSDPSTCSCTSWRCAPLGSGIRVDEVRQLASDLLAILPARNGNVRPSAFIGPPSLGGLTVRPVAG